MLEERRVIKQIQILPESDTIQVQWADQILRDGEVITEQFHRKAYAQEQKKEFLAEVEGVADLFGVWL